jgi:hypothetical protein
MVTATQTEEDDGEAFMRSIAWCWEDLLLRHPNFVWHGEYRWFKAANIIPLERHRPPGWKWGDARSRQR